MPNGVPSKTSSLSGCVQRAEIFSSMWSQWRYVNLHTHLQPKNDFNPEAPALKRKKERKRWRKSFFLKNVVFYEHGFRSAGMFLPNAFEELVTVPTICSWLADGCWWFAHIFWRCLLKMQELHKSVLFPARRTLNPRHFTFKLQTWENHSIFEQGFPDATHNPWLDFPVAREASIYNPSHYCILCIYAVRV